jgi:hypothetical protein
MSFGAMPIWAGVLLIAAAGALAARLFLLKLRPPHIIVPSLLFWRRVLDESRELTFWERIRRAVSLVVTISIAVLLAIAFTRPSRMGGSAVASRGRLLIVLDSSWSMLTRTRNGETRWDRAIAEARRLAVAASGDQVAIATTADGLVEGPTSDIALLETALDKVRPSGGETSAWPKVAGTQVVHFITDGTIARPLDAPVIVDSVFEPAANVAITAFDVRASLEDNHPADGYLEVANFGATSQRVHLSLSRGSSSIHEQDLDLDANEAARLAVPLPAGGDPLLRARLRAPADALAIDDEAFAWIVRARPLQVTVVSDQPAWIAGLLDKDRNVRAAFATPLSYRPAGEDVVIFDRWAPKDPPVKPALCFAPPPDAAWLSSDAPAPSGGSGGYAPEKQPRWTRVGTHPVVRGVDPFTLSIDRVRAYRSASLVPVATSEHGTPLISTISSPQRRAVVVAFGPADSNLAAAPGFPVLVTNAVEWLARPEINAPRRPGQAVLDSSITRLTAPDGRAVALQHVHDSAIALLKTPGIYVAESGGARSSFAVNVGDPQVSNVQRTSIATARSRAVSAGATSQAWWIYAALLGFALLVAEWATWQRRITV